MATAYVYNGFGKYEDREGILGMTLSWAGLPFFFPFEQVTPIPDWTLREVDYDKTTPDENAEGELVYKTFLVNGKRVAEELIQAQHNSEKGIIEIEGKPTGKRIEVRAGVDSEGRPILTEVTEKEATKAEANQAATLAIAFKKQVVQEYFQSKRERMTGGKGRLSPLGAVKTYMDELQIDDLDDVNRFQRTNGIDADLIRLIIEETRKAGELNGATLLRAIETVRKGDGPQLAKSKNRSAGLATYKETYDEAIAAGKSPSEAKELATAAKE